MNCWKQLDALRKEANDLETQLDSMGWSLLPPTAAGEYRAKKRGGRRERWKEVSAKTAALLIERAAAEIQRHEKPGQSNEPRIV